VTPRATGGGGRRSRGKAAPATSEGGGTPAPRARRNAGARGAADAGSRPDARTAPLELFGHHEARERIRAELAQGSLPRVLLVAGPRGIGKETFGFWVARLLLCEGPEPRPCGRCSSCLKIATLQHPDVHWFFPVPAESGFDEGRWIKRLDEIRKDPLDPELKRFDQPASFRMHQAATIRKLAATKSFQGGEQVFVLGNYEQNPSDQVHNALLKVFEEPPPRTTFVLTTSRLQGLPATILSRCRPVRLRPLQADEMRAFAAAAAARLGRDLDARRESEILARAEGRPGRVIELLHAVDDAVEEAAAMLRAAIEGGPVASYAWTARNVGRGSREDHNRRLDALAALWRDLLRVHAGSAEPLLRPDLIDLYRDASERLEPQRGAEAALEIERGRERIQANVYAALVFWKLFHVLASSFESRASRAPAAYSAS
jgi:DNA polymerase III delta prime subunit